MYTVKLTNTSYKAAIRKLRLITHNAYIKSFRVVQNKPKYAKSVANTTRCLTLIPVSKVEKVIGKN